MAWVAAAAAVVGGLVTAYEKAQANGASANELAALKQMIAQAREPNFNTADFTPEQYQVVSQYNPEVAAYVAEQNPTLVTGQTAEAKAGGQARLDALSRYQQLSNDGTDVQSKLLQQEAARTAAANNQGMQGQIQDNMARRGMAGSGNELALALSAQQQAGQTGALVGQKNAQSAYNTRLDALAQAGRLGGDIQNDANSLEGKNAGITNAFNERTTAARQSYNNNAAQTRNLGQLTNLNNAQDAANKNTTARNNAQQDNINRSDKNQQQVFQNDIAKATGQLPTVTGANALRTDTANTNGQVATGISQAAGIAADKYFTSDEEKKKKATGAI